VVDRSLQLEMKKTRCVGKTWLFVPKQCLSGEKHEIHVVLFGFAAAVFVLFLLLLLLLLLTGFMSFCSGLSKR
jgi:IS4 transposase